MMIIILVSCALAVVCAENWNQHNSGAANGWNSQNNGWNAQNNGWNAQNNGWNGQKPGWNAAWNAGNQYHAKQIYPEHVPVIQDGVPVETSEVQAAKAEHYALYAQARDLAEKHRAEYRDNNEYDNNGNYYGQAQQRIPYAQPAYQNVQYNNHAAPLYPNQYHNAGGVVETPEVQEARAAHLQEHSKALIRAAAHGPQQQYRHKRSLDVGHYQNYYHGPQHIPIIKKDGVPVDTLEVQHARAQHLWAVSAAKARNPWSATHEDGSWNDDGHNNGWSYGNLGAQVNYNIHHDDHYGKYYGPQHLPILTKQGVPVDTLEVQAARHQHLNALVLAKNNHGDWQEESHNLGWNSNLHHNNHVLPVLTSHGVPQDTPAVRIAKIHHLQAHAEEQHRSLAHNDQHWD